MNVYLLGGSKNIGYYAALRLLKHGATVTFLLRSTSVFDDDATIQEYIKKGQAHLVKGDALKADTVKAGWEAALAAGNGTVDLLLFTVGGTPSFSLTKGFVVTPPDLCTHSLRNVVSTLPAALRAPGAQPRFVVITSNGCTASGHEALPLAVLPVYKYMLPGPHADKLGAERVLAHMRGAPWAGEDVVKEKVLPEGWMRAEGMVGEGEVRRVVAIRPALLTDGACKADEPPKKGRAPYRVSAGRDLDGAYTVSRRDTAHFIVEELLKNWEKYEGEAVAIAY